MQATEENYLINEILNGDSEAFAVLVNRYKRPIFNLMLRMTGSWEDANDLTQDAFLKVYEQLANFKPSRKFFPWMYTISMNLARDHLRRQKSAVNAYQMEQNHHCVSVDPNGEAQRLVRRLDAQRLPELLSELPEDYRESLILRFQEGLTMKDIGAALGITASGAKMRIKRGLQRLRDLL